MSDYEPRGSTHDYGRRPEGHEEDAPSPGPAPAGGPGGEPPGGSSGNPAYSTGEAGTAFSAASQEERTLAMFAHLGGVIAWMTTAGFLAWAVPLVIWLLKREQSPLVDDQGKEALNFQITGLFATVILVVLGLFTALTLGLGLCLLIPFALGWFLYALVFAIIAGIKAYDGERYRYPFCIRLIS
ncbi:MAG: DUF4870 domain-containing protein [Planctomycetota bacterium]